MAPLQFGTKRFDFTFIVNVALIVEKLARIVLQVSKPILVEIIVKNAANSAEHIGLIIFAVLFYGGALAVLLLSVAADHRHVLRNAPEIPRLLFEARTGPAMHIHCSSCIDDVERCRIILGVLLALAASLAHAHLVDVVHKVISHFFVFVHIILVTVAIYVVRHIDAHFVKLAHIYLGRSSGFVNCVD